jgi:imidazolonepropionase-like amidohydrolase
MSEPVKVRPVLVSSKNCEALIGQSWRWVRDYAKAGGQVLFGTDVGYMTDYDPAEEYRLLARALAPMEILASLTTAPAARWKEGEVRGRVLQGQVADLVVLNADPAADAANFANVRCTLRAGNPTYTAPVGVR